MHVGHTRYLQAAKDLGDLLVVGVNSERVCQELEQGAGSADRSGCSAGGSGRSAELVDYVIIFDEPDPQSLIASLQPDVLVKGGDWAVERIIGRDIVEARGGVVHTIPLVPGISTATLIERIRSTTT